MGELSEKLRRQAMGLGRDQKPESPSEEFGDIQRAHREGLKERVYLHGLGIEPATAERPVDDIRLNVGELFKAQTESTKGLTNQVLEMQRTRPEDPFLKYILDELKGVRDRLDAAQGQDPLQGLMQAQMVLDNLAEKMKKREGVSGDVRVLGQDLPGLLKLEELKLDREERARQWQEDMAERRHQWEEERGFKEHQWAMEQKRWEANFTLEKDKFEDERKRNEKTGEALEDILSGLGATIDQAFGTKDQPSGLVVERVKSEAVPSQRGFKCEVCENPVPLLPDTKVGDKVLCPQCQAEYTVGQKATA